MRVPGASFPATSSRLSLRVPLSVARQPLTPTRSHHAVSSLKLPDAHAERDRARRCLRLLHVTNSPTPSLDLPGNDTWVTYSDGAARGNPGPASYGAAVIDPEGVLRDEISVAIGVNTNNVAEYEG